MWTNKTGKSLSTLLGTQHIRELLLPTFNINKKTRHVWHDKYTDENVFWFTGIYMFTSVMYFLHSVFYTLYTKCKHRRYSCIAQAFEVCGQLGWRWYMQDMFALIFHLC